MPREFRHAHPEDAAVLAAIDAGVSINPWSERQFTAACSDIDSSHASALVVEESGHVSGFVVYSQVLDEASIHNIAIHSVHQGKGIGQLLLAAALQQMKCAGATRCLLEVRQSNTAARRLYERTGFALDGVRKNYYPTQGGREDALLMSRAL